MIMLLPGQPSEKRKATKKEQPQGTLTLQNRQMNKEILRKENAGRKIEKTSHPELKQLPKPPGPPETKKLPVMKQLSVKWIWNLLNLTEIS